MVGSFLLVAALLGVYGAFTGRLPAMLAALFDPHGLVKAQSGILPGMPIPSESSSGGTPTEGPAALPPVGPGEIPSGGSAPALPPGYDGAGGGPVIDVPSIPIG